MAFFLTLMKARQYILRALLAYRGWLCESNNYLFLFNNDAGLIIRRFMIYMILDENMKSQSIKTVVWAVLVRMVSGYSPSLYSCQRSLPRLPVPNLQVTMKTLIESLKPICSEKELEDLQREADEFKNSPLASRLQRILILKSWWVPNYVSDWWYVTWVKLIQMTGRVFIASSMIFQGKICLPQESKSTSNKFQLLRNGSKLLDSNDSSNCPGCNSPTSCVSF